MVLAVLAVQGTSCEARTGGWPRAAQSGRPSCRVQTQRPGAGPQNMDYNPTRWP